METKLSKYQWSWIIAIISGLLFVFFSTGYESCLSAADRESTFNRQIQTRAERWARENSQLNINSIMCNPRGFGNRMPSDPTYCRAMANNGIKLVLFCNMNGCHIHYPQEY